MISDLQSYALSDFIPFSREVYHSLFSYYNEQIWPIQIIFIAAAVTLLILFVRGPKQTFLLPGIFLAGAWWWSGLVFLQQYFIHILPQAQWGTVLFVIQGVACLIPALGPGNLQPSSKRTLPFWIGYGLFAATSLLPFHLLLGQSMTLASQWGWAPTGTSLGTVGIIMMTSGQPRRWLLLVIPLLWLIFALLLAIGLSNASHAG